MTKYNTLNAIRNLLGQISRKDQGESCILMCSWKTNCHMKPKLKQLTRSHFSSRPEHKKSNFENFENQNFEF